MVDLKSIEVTDSMEEHPNVMIELYNELKRRVAYLRIPSFSKDLFSEKP